MRRREFITLAGGAAAAWPLGVRAQTERLPTIGFLNPQASGPLAENTTAFQQALGKMGYVEDRNMKIDYRWAQNHVDQLPALAADLVRERVDVIVAFSASATSAAKAATSTIPIVFNTGTDPVKLGFVASLNSPGGNLTGVSFLVNSLVAKQLEVLHELIPKAKTMGLLLNPEDLTSGDAAKDVQAAADQLELKIVVVEASAEMDFERAFANLIEQHAEALLIAPNPFFNIEPKRLAVFAERHALPAIYGLPQYARAGGLMSYGTNNAESWRIAGEYAGRILKGEKAGNLPVQLLTKVELIINLKAAKVLGFTFPLSLLGRADEVIE